MPDTAWILRNGEAVGNPYRGWYNGKSMMCQKYRWYESRLVSVPPATFNPQLRDAVDVETVTERRWTILPSLLNAEDAEGGYQ